MAMDGKYGIVLGVELNNSDLSAIVNELKKFNDSFGKIQLMDTKQFQELKAEVSNLKGQIDKLKTSSKEAFDAKSLEDFKNKIKKIADEFKNGSKTAQDMADASKKMQNALYDRKGGLNENALKLNTGELKEYLALIQKVKTEQAKPIKDGVLVQKTELSVFTKDAKELIQVIEVYKNSMGQVQTITNLVDKETRELIATNERLVTQYKNSMVSKFQQDVTDLTDKLNLGGTTLDSYIKKLNEMMYLKNGTKTPAFASLDTKSQIAIQNELAKAQALQNKNLNEEYAIRTKLASATLKEAEAQQKLNFDVKEFKKMQLNRLEILGAKGADSAQIDALRQKIQDLSATTPQLRQQMKGLSNDVTILGTTAKKTGSMLQFLGMYFSIHAIINTTRRAITSMTSTIYDLDSALISLQKVTDLSGSSLKSFTEDAYILGSQISKSGSDVIKASTEFAKAGYDESQLQGLAKSALILTSIGDGITDVGESASTIIAVLRGFGKETTDVTNILDMVNNVSNNASVSFQDITLALQRMSGTMHSAGVGMEETIGMFTAINEVLRNTEMTSTALNTLSMRIRGLGEDGEAIDGLAPKLKDMYKNIADVDLTDSNGQLRNMFDILKDLAPKWDSLTVNQKQYMAQQTAGVRQAKSFLVLMDNFDRALETTELAYDSAGSSAREFAIWQESLEGKLNNLKSAWEQLATTTLNSGFIKGVLDATTALVKFANACGGLLPVLASVGIAFAVFKFAPLVGVISNLTYAFGVLILKLTGVAMAMNAVNLALSMSVAGVAIVAIMGIGYALNYTANEAKKAKKEIAELTEGLDSLKGEYEQLERVDNPTQGQKDKLERLEQEIIAREKIIALKKSDIAEKELGSIGTNNTRLAYFDPRAPKSAYSTADIDYGTGDIGEVNKLQQVLEKQIQTYNKLREELGKYKTGTEEYTAILKTMSAQEAGIGETRLKLSDGLNKMTSNYEALGSTAKSAISGVFTSLSELAKVSIFKADNLDGQVGLKRITVEYKEELLELIKVQKESGDGAIDYEAKAESMSITVEDLTNAMSLLKKEILEANVAMIASDFVDLTDMVKKTIDDVTDLNGAINSLNDNQILTSKTILDLINKYPELRDKVTEVNGVYSLSADILEEVRQRQIDEANSAIQGQIDKENAIIIGTKNRLAMYRTEITAIKTLAQAQSALVGMAVEKAKSERFSSNLHYFGVGEAPKPDPIYEQKVKDLQAIAGAYKNIEELESKLQDIKIGTSIANTKAGSNIKSKKDASSAEKYAKYLEKGLEDAISLIQSKGDKLAKELELLDSKIALASAKGNVDLTKELEEQKTQLLDKQLKNISDSASKLSDLKAKWVKELQAQNLPELKGVDLQNLTQEQLNAVSRAYEAKIAQMTNKNQAKQKASLEFSKGMFEEFAQQILKVNDLISQAGHDMLGQQIANLSHATEKIGKVFDAHQNKYDNSLAQLELEQILMNENSDLYVEKEKEKGELILELQKATIDSIVEYRKQGLSDETTEVKQALSKWLDLEKQYRQQQRKLAERARQDRIDSLRGRLDTLKEQQDSITTLHEMVMKFLKQEANERKKSLQDELSARREIIKEEVDGYTKIVEARKKSLQKESDDRSYEKGLRERQKKVSDAESKLLQLQFDNSDAGKAKKKLLADELKAYQEELEDYQYKNSIDKQTEALDQELANYKDTKDKELTTFEKTIEAQIKAIEEYLSKEGQLRLDAIALIESGNRDLYNKLMKWNKDYGDGIDATVSNAWDSARSALGQFNNGQMNVLKTLESITAEMKRVNKELEIANKSTFEDYLPKSNVTDRPNSPVIPETPKAEPKPQSNAPSYQQWAEEQQASQQRYLHSEMVKALNEKNMGLQKWIREERPLWGLNPHSGGIEIKGKIPEYMKAKYNNLYKTYHTGGVVGGSSQLKLKSNEEFAKLLKGEVVVNSSQMDTFMKDTLPKLVGHSGSDTPSVSQTFQINVEGSLDKSVLPLLEEWAIKIQNSTIGALNGTRTRSGISTNALKFAF